MPQSRYTIAGFRGGETLRTPAGDIRLHPHDAAAALTAEQLAYFKANGQAVAKAADEPPTETQAHPNPLDEQIAVALKRGEQQAAAVSRAPTPPATETK